MSKYKANISGLILKQVEANNATRAILSVSYDTIEEGRTLIQDLWLPSSSTSEKATKYYESVLTILGIEKTDYVHIYNEEWEKAVDKNFVFEIETEVDKRGKEIVKYVNDPDNPVIVAKKIEDSNLLAMLGLSGATEESEEDKVPF